MKKDFTHIVALLDKSGSMQSVLADTIGGFNTFLEEQKKVPGEATITLAQFSGGYEVSYADVPLAHVAHLTAETYVPSGWTALNDALAKTITDVGTKLAAKKEDERPSKVIVLIMTDGQENSSKEFVGQAGLQKLNEMVTHQKAKYSWDFVFVGANIDSFAAASTYGIPLTYTINYSSTGIGSANAFKSVSRGMTAARMTTSAGGTLGNFFENEANTVSISDATLDSMDISETIKKYAGDATVTPPTSTGTLVVDTVTSDPQKQTTTTSDSVK